MFVLSKYFDLMDSPLNFLYLYGAVATILLFTAKARLGRMMLVVLVIAGAGLMLFPIDRMVAQRIEDRFPPTNPPDRVDGFVVLGGAIDLKRSVDRDRPSLGDAGERITEMIALMHRYPKAQGVFSGGSGDPFDQTHSEADVVNHLLSQMGIDTSRIVFERTSRNTRENALFSRQMIAPKEGENWLLVTSAGHMPRAMGSFRAVGWSMQAWPVNFQNPWRSDDFKARGLSLERLQIWHNTAHEIFGMVYYRLRGWTPTLFPAP